MIYHEPVYRPPSEANSLIIQATLGCSYNKCTFCGMYKTKRYQVREFTDFKQDVMECAGRYPHTTRIFLADGDALAMNTSQLIKSLRLCYSKFPHLERISIYASPQSVFSKTSAELEQLKDEGLGICYYGIESGDDEVLSMVKKGYDSKGIIKAGQLLVNSGLTVSITVILGLGGKAGSHDHIIHTASAINEIQPQYTSALTLMLYDYEELFRRLCKGKWEPVDMFESLEEVRLLIDGIHISTLFRSNHASNYLPIKATLPQDKTLILRELDKIIASQDVSRLRPEFYRGL